MFEKEQNQLDQAERNYQEMLIKPTEELLQIRDKASADYDAGKRTWGRAKKVMFIFAIIALLNIVYSWVADNNKSNIVSIALLVVFVPYFIWSFSYSTRMISAIRTIAQVDVVLKDKESK
jgi:hypothetical protein